jgi:hypothetical protein
MSASSNLAFSAEPFGTASYLSKPSSPIALVVLFGAVLFGLFTGILVSLYLNSVAEKKVLAKKVSDFS